MKNNIIYPKVNSNMSKFTLPFQKIDKFKNNVFICRHPDENYNLLTDLYSKLEDKYPDAVLPVYINNEHEYATLRVVKNTKYSFKEKNTYELAIQFRMKQGDGRCYINAVLTNSKCVNRHIEDHGQNIEI